MTNQQNPQPHHGVQDNSGGPTGFSLPPGFGKGVRGVSGVGGIGAPDLRRSSAEERVCPRCNINVKTSIPGHLHASKLVRCVALLCVPRAARHHPGVALCVPYPLAETAFYLPTFLGRLLDRP